MTESSHSEPLNGAVAPDPELPLNVSPLLAEHTAAGATFTDFAGWEMPVRYTSDLAEHHLVRNAAGLFDLSHMGQIEIQGTYAGPFLDFALSGNMSKLTVGQAKYTLILNPDGTVIDDLIVYRMAPTTYLIVANAANVELVTFTLIDRRQQFGVRVKNASHEYGLIALQGPAAESILGSVASLELVTGELGAESLEKVRYYRIVRARIAGHDVLLARTGYTGEDGFEIFTDAEHAVEIWQLLLAAGDDTGLAACGLACRDTLRLEAGMPLYGHELSDEIMPHQAGLKRVVHLDKPEDFVGRAACERAFADPGAAPVLVGLQSEGKRAGREGYQLYRSGDQSGQPIGIITSGALSPTLGYPIAMAYVSPDYAELGTVIDIDVRGKRLPATVVSLPFYRRPAQPSPLTPPTTR